MMPAECYRRNYRYHCRCRCLSAAAADHFYHRCRPHLQKEASHRILIDVAYSVK